VNPTSPPGADPPRKKATDRGIVHADQGRRAFVLTRHPALSLEPWVEHLWEVQWELPPGQGFTQKVLSFPNLHLVWETEGGAPSRAWVYGVPRRPYERTLRDGGRALGVRFRPGGWSAFAEGAAAGWTGRTVPAAELWAGADGAGTSPESVRVFLESLARPVTPEASEADQLVALVRDSPGLRRVEELAQAAGLSVRSLQRLFHRMVGVSPKWVIRRFRLQEAALVLEQDPKADLGLLAHRLGYFDQAHFARDFKSVLGVPPGRY